jgi:hypothetical protein
MGFKGEDYVSSNKSSFVVVFHKAREYVINHALKQQNIGAGNIERKQQCFMNAKETKNKNIKSLLKCNSYFLSIPRFVFIFSNWCSIKPHCNRYKFCNIDHLSSMTKMKQHVHKRPDAHVHHYFRHFLNH